MRILACLLLPIVIFFSGNSCLAQQERIDSLKKVLPALHDSARVDCLNALSGFYVKFIRDTMGYCTRPLCESTSWPTFSRLALYYADLAHEEALKTHYIHGMAESLSYKGEVEELSDNFMTCEKFSREAIKGYRETANKKRLAETYFNLAHSLYAQSFFSESIRNFDTAYEWHKKNGNTSGMFWALTVESAVYHASGNYEKAFELSRECFDIATETKNDWFRRGALEDIGWVYDEIDDHKTALEYYRLAGIDLKPDTLGLAQTFTSQHQYDSARFYYNLVDTSNQRIRRFYFTSIGEYYYLLKQYDKSLAALARGLELHRQLNDRNPVMQTLVDISRTYLKIGNTDSAILYGTEALRIARETGAKQIIKDASETLSAGYDYRHQPDSAYFYFRQYTTMKDSIFSDRVKGKLAAYNFERKMEMVNKEKQIQKVQLQKQSLLRNILIGSMIIGLLLAGVIFRNIILKRKNEKHQLEHKLELQQFQSEKIKAEMQHQATDLEMQALRAQMNPHFIFNSLNSINRFILQNDKLQASGYLTKFSRLVRLILQNSQDSLTTLDRELDALRLYIELEALRFDHQFDYKINVSEDLDTEILKVPPLIIQPFAENAIWHGLMHKEDKGCLLINIYQEEDDILCCKITDDGVGRNRAAELKSKSAATHKPMGMQITADRIAVLKQKKEMDCIIKTTDLVLPDGSAGGTEVLLKIPVNL